jgi:tetratricopeptide (TPR) repeat protein
MASIIPGYEYDIFISYRQKDNKGDMWVSEFVEALKTELESTFKEEISVYFDINPHDGLLDTYDVNASLKEKLKCLIFIPIISRTYCDPKSFAWEHEFKAFIEQATGDQFGMQVKLPNGNVANRVLPIQLHDLNAEDKALFEKELGGVLRAIYFIYKEPGVNRPLTPEDEEKKNLNNTRYRNQINKVANSIDEIIRGLKSDQNTLVKEKIKQREPLEEVNKVKKHIEKENSTKLNRTKQLSGFGILAVIVIAALLVYHKIFKRDDLEKLRSSDGRISVVVMPFQNMTNDTIWDVWQDGIQNELITSLSNSEEIKVRQTETINSVLQSKGLTNYASIVPSVASAISQKLDANVFVYGSIKQAGGTIRLNAQLINSKTKEPFKSFQIDGTYENILHITDSLSVMVKNSLIISKLEKELPAYLQYHPSTTSSEAYRYYLYGENARKKRDYPTAKNMFSQALAIDSNFTAVTLMLSIACVNQGAYEEGRKWDLKAYAKRDHVPIRLKILINNNHAFFFETPFEEIKYLRQLLEIDDKFPGTYYDIGLIYYRLFLYDKAIPEFEKALEIYDKLDSKPWWVFDYTLLGYSYHKTGQYKKEKKLYRKADQDFPYDPSLSYMHAVLSLSEGDTITANKYIEKYISVRRENSWSEAAIAYNLGEIYSEAGNLEKAEQYHRKELSLEPQNAFRIYDLAWFLIDKDRNINEGLELIDKALELRPNYHLLLDCKGWGLYKQGKYKEALELLEKSRDLSPYYRHSVYLHIQEVKKAIANQKTSN